jgi:hypothetical protein
MGDARGHWEGSTLVVETTNFLPNKTGIGLNGGGVPTSEALKLTERYTRVDPATINYEVTIDDPGAYTRPWTTGFFIRWTPNTEAAEYICQDNNQASTMMVGNEEGVDRGSRIVP